MSRRSSRPSSAASYSSSRSYGVDSEFRLECKAAFLSIYDDLQDVINSEEDLSAALQQAGRNPSRKVLAKHWRDDTDYLTFDQFVQICRQEPVTTVDDLMKAFKKIDINGDGYISLDELYRMLTTRGEKMSRQEVKEMIDEVDENRDGRLDYQEFCNMVMSTTEECKKMSMKLMEKKERKKRKGGRPDTGSRRGEIDGDIRDVLDTQDDLGLSARSSARTPRTLNASEKRGSLLSLRSNRSVQRETDDQDIFGAKKSPRKISDSRAPSHSSLRSVGRTGSKSSLISVDDMPRPSPRVRKDKMQHAVGSTRSARFSEPSNLREWTHTSSKGCFFLDTDDGAQIVSHQYLLDLPSESNVFITIQPTRIADGGQTDDGPIDTALYVVKEKSSSVERLVTFTEQRDSKGKYAVRCDLPAGRYRLLPFTTGCRLKDKSHGSVKEAKLIKKDKDDNVVLTKAFKKVLEDIFDMADLDGNGLLSREEFNWYNLRTSGDEVADDEWAVVEGNVDLKDDEITKEGFVRLNEMEAEDNEGDADDLWVTVSSMGFNKALVLDQACPFKVNVYTEDCDDAELRVVSLDPAGEELEEAVCESVIAKGEQTSVRGMRDLNVYTYIGDARATVVVENRSHSKVRVELDCTKSKNVQSNVGDLDTVVTAASNTRVIGMHLIPRDERSEWMVRCNEAIQK